MSSGPFTVSSELAETECDCITDPCQHPDRQRTYTAWIVWDNERHDHAFNTRPDFGFQPEYDRKRDAVHAVDVYLHRMIASR